MPDPTGPGVATQPLGFVIVADPSLSVYEILHVGEVALSSAANVRRVWRSVKPIGSESITCDVGAARLTHVATWPFAGQESLKVRNSVSRSDWKFVTPVFQLFPMDGSPAPRPMYSTVGPVVKLTGVSTPGASKFW